MYFFQEALMYVNIWLTFAYFLSVSAVSIALLLYMDM